MLKDLLLHAWFETVLDFRDEEDEAISTVVIPDGQIVEMILADSIMQDLIRSQNVLNERARALAASKRSRRN